MSPKQQSKRARFAINAKRARQGLPMTKAQAVMRGAANWAAAIDAGVYRRSMVFSFACKADDYSPESLRMDAPTGKFVLPEVNHG